MKYSIIIVLALTIGVFACKSKDNDKTSNGQEASQATAPSNQPKEYTVTFSPDTAVLGKNKEALVKITGATAIAKQDPDGKDNGTELVISMILTNRGKINEGSHIDMEYTNSRLQLDNGNNITCETGTDYLRADAEATSKEEKWTYEVPAGTKPKTLNLFYDDTRVSVDVTMK